MTSSKRDIYAFDLDTGFEHLWANTTFAACIYKNELTQMKNYEGVDLTK